MALQSQDDATTEESESGQPNSGNLPPRYMQILFGRIFPWPFFLIGLAVLVFGIRGLLEANASTHWQTTTGTVTHSDVTVSRSSDGTMFGASVVYEFEIDGSRHIGDRVNASDFQSSSRAAALRVVERYPVGMEVTVYCHPNEPERSLLEPGISTSAFFLPGFGLVFFLAGSAMLIFLPKLLNNPNLQWSIH